MRCKYRRRKRVTAERYVVYLNWKGKRWQRTNYDDKLPICTEEMANRLCEMVNGDIERRGKAFDPRRWFATKTSDMRFDNYGKNWLSRKSIQETTRDIYERILNEAREVFGNFDIREIRKPNITEYLNNLPAEMSPNTKKHRLDVLHALFSDAFNDEDISRIPGWPKIKTIQAETKTLSYEEQLRVFEHIQEHDRPIFQLMTALGLRVSEAIALQWDCILWQKKEIIIKRTMSGQKVRESRKSGDRLPLPMSDEIMDMLRPLRQFTGFVFLNRNGKRYHRQNLLRTLQTACKKAKVREVTLHQFCRHSKGGQLINAGVSERLISALFGHSSTQHTRRYTPLKTEALRGLVR